MSGKDVAGLLAYLGLREAAKRDVGTGANQIPDMSLFASINTVTAAAQKFPSGLV
ncbi:phage tail protein, partial [Escherichia coli]|nr:phage tail protein [Escherichia coli]